MKRTITIDLPPTLDAILVEKATGDDTPETLCATIIKEWCMPHAVAKETAIRAALAQNEDLMAIGKEVAAAPPEKQAAAIAAAHKALA